MAFRDDAIALEHQRDIVQREVSALETELGKLVAEGKKLRRALARQRALLAVRRLGKWLVRHPKTTLLLALLLGLFGYCQFDRIAEERARRERLAAVVGRGCSTVLRVNASHEGAAVHVNGMRLGVVPQEVSICRGDYLLQVNHRRTLPWHRHIVVRSQQELAFNVNLVSFKAHERPAGGVLFLSTPPAALLFVNGHEVGRTPILVPRVEIGRTDPMLLALWAEGHRAAVWRVSDRPVVWLHLNPLDTAPPR